MEVVLCRLCVTAGKDMIQALNKNPRDSHENVDPYEVLVQKIYFALDITVNSEDLLSKWLCLQCITKLNNSYDFKTKCKAAELFLNKYRADLDNMVLSSELNDSTMKNEISSTITNDNVSVPGTYSKEIQNNKSPSKLLGTRRTIIIDANQATSSQTVTNNNNKIISVPEMEPNSTILNVVSPKNKSAPAPVCKTIQPKVVEIKEVPMLVEQRSQEQYECAKCGQMFNTKNGREIHVQNEHCLSCPMCFRKCKTRVGLLNHCRVIHPTVNRRELVDSILDAKVTQADCSEIIDAETEVTNVIPSTHMSQPPSVVTPIFNKDVRVSLRRLTKLELDTYLIRKPVPSVPKNANFKSDQAIEESIEVLHDVAVKIRNKRRQVEYQYLDEDEESCDDPDDESYEPVTGNMSYDHLDDQNLDLHMTSNSGNSSKVTVSTSLPIERARKVSLGMPKLSPRNTSLNIPQLSNIVKPATKLKISQMTRTPIMKNIQCSDIRQFIRPKSQSLDKSKSLKILDRAIENSCKKRKLPLSEMSALFRNKLSIFNVRTSRHKDMPLRFNVKFMPNAQIISKNTNRVTPGHSVTETEEDETFNKRLKEMLNTDSKQWLSQIYSDIRANVCPVLIEKQNSNDAGKMDDEEIVDNEVQVMEIDTTRDNKTCTLNPSILNQPLEELSLLLNATSTNTEQSLMMSNKENNTFNIRVKSLTELESEAMDDISSVESTVSQLHDTEEY